MMENFLGIFLKKNKANVEPVVKIQSKVISVPNVDFFWNSFDVFANSSLSIILYYVDTKRKSKGKAFSNYSLKMRGNLRALLSTK